MMDKIIFSWIFCVVLLGCFSCKEKCPEKGLQKVLIETNYGEITVELYDDTPLHKANFVRLVKQKSYDDLLFHRVIKNFMIQSGDPDSRNAKAYETLGSHEMGKTIASEIHYPIHFNKRGALVAARKNDIDNPNKSSSGSQFFIVWGRKLSSKEIKVQERLYAERILKQLLNIQYKKHQSMFDIIEKQNDFVTLQAKIDSLQTLIKKENQALFQIPDSIKTYYQTFGGMPELDNEYTVFGEVTKGLEVVEKIQKLPVDNHDRPLQDIKIKMKLVK